MRDESRKNSDSKRQLIMATHGLLSVDDGSREKLQWKSYSHKFKLSVMKYYRENIIRDGLQIKLPCSKIAHLLSYQLSLRMCFSSISSHTMILLRPHLINYLFLRQSSHKY